MKTHQVMDSVSSRLRRPSTWGVVVVFGCLWNGLRWLAGPEILSAGEFLLPFAFGILLLGLAAAPWQWTGDNEAMASLSRGLAQALPWNALLLLVLILLLPEHTGGGRGGRGGANPLGLFPNLPPRLLILLVACGAFGMLSGWILADRDQEALRADTQARLARKAQTRALQGQMNPHVLFNTLSGLAELAREDGVATERALVTLAGLLRNLMHHSALTSVTLDDERGLVEGFLSLERIRLGERLAVIWDWDARLEDTEVPPLLLQPLVENAIKHGIAPWREGGELTIGLSGTPDRLRLWVSNTGRSLGPNEVTGTGLNNLRQRLALLEGFQSHLDLRTEGGRTTAELLLEAAGD